jgi:hypothetical protein
MVKTLLKYLRAIFQFHDSDNSLPLVKILFRSIIGTFERGKKKNWNGRETRSPIVIHHRNLLWLYPRV